MVIATLLVPLNFVAMASFYKEQINCANTGHGTNNRLAFSHGLVALAAKVLTPQGVGALCRQ